jgi:hypothetical protein
VAKYRNPTRSVIDPDRQGAIGKAVLNVEALEDISTLTELLTPAVRAALGWSPADTHSRAAPADVVVPGWCREAGGPQ